MVWTAQMVDGFLLASAAHDEHDTSRVLAALEGRARESVAGAIDRLASLDHAGRRQALARHAANAFPHTCAANGLPPMARRLVASDADPTVGRAWLTAASAPRRGFSAGSRLRRQLKRLAWSTPVEGSAAARERQTSEELREGEPWSV